MIALVCISFLEVAIYSYLVNTGQPESFYEEHANISAPYISGIFGFIIFFFVVSYWKKKYYDARKIAILYPLVYILLDIVILLLADIEWSYYFSVFAIANGAKILGAFLGYQLTGRSRVTQTTS
jgi:hypothetical protein